MPNVPAELKPAVSKYIAPEALFWFRWSALATWVFGLALAALRLDPRLPVVLHQHGRDRGQPEHTEHLHGHGHVAGHDHVPERLGHHLAEPEDRAGQAGRRSR